MVDEQSLARRGGGLCQLLVIRQHIDQTRLPHIRAPDKGIFRLRVLRAHRLPWRT